MQRRHLLTLGAGGLLAGMTRRGWSESAPPDTETVARLRREWQALLAPNTKLVEARPAIERSADAWREALPADAWGVLFQEDTEPAGTSPLNDEHREGVFACRACGLALFTSAMKYDSGTGWPSFFTSIDGHLATKRDYKLLWPRTEYHCVKCGGHQGHVFNDGPAPTGQRWCNNGVALTFLPRTPG